MSKFPVEAKHRGRLGWLITGLMVVAAGCGREDSVEDAAAESTRPLRVVATTNLVADLAKRVAGDAATVTSLMGPGVDPHLYKASEGDVRSLAEADLILYNGLHLEGKMGDILVKMARDKLVVAVTEAIPQTQLREPPEFAGQYDPHVWFDVGMWAMTVRPVADALSRLRPASSAVFQQNAAALENELRELDAWVGSRIAEIPESSRLLVTAHDAFGYFGHRYGLEVIGIQGISTVSEAGLGDVQRVVDLVVARRVKALFVESSVPRRSIEAVQAAVAAAGHQVAIGGELFSDSLGAAGTPEGTYPGMVRHNVETIVGGLR